MVIMGTMQYICVFLCFTGVLSETVSDLTAFLNSSIGACNSDQKISDDFVQIGEKSYLVNTSIQMNWFEAEHVCRTYGSDLITIQSDAEMDAINDYLTKNNHTGKYFWTSGNDLAHEGKYMWLSSGNVMNYSKWGERQPDDGGNQEDCVHLWVEHGRFLMNDFPCFFDGYPICEMKKSSSNPLSSCALKALIETFDTFDMQNGQISI